MAMRRLLAFAALLLGMLVLANAVAPEDLREDADRTETRPLRPPVATGREEASEPPGEGLVRVTLPRPRGAGDDVVRIRSGDLVELTVRAPGPDSAIIQGLDLIQPADATTPARFEFVADLPGSYPVVLRLSNQTVGELRIGAPEERR